MKSSSESKSAQPAIYNIFDQNIALSKFIGISIDRSDDMETTSGGRISISEYDPRFSAVEHSPKYPLAPTDTARWTIAMDQLEMNGHKYELTSDVQGAALDTTIALIDSGTSLAYIPESAVDFIYSNIPGALHLHKDGEYVWVVPCLQPANLTFSFGFVCSLNNIVPYSCSSNSGNKIAINPLELTLLQTIIEDDQQWTVCVNAFQPQLSVGSGDLDFLLGDIFMRNVYSMCARIATI